MTAPIEKITDLIIQTLHPNKIILFGSRARGDAETRSDIDIAVDSDPNDASAWHRLLEKLEHNPPTLLPIDLIQISRAPSRLREKIRQEGILLYDSAKDPG